MMETQSRILLVDDDPGLTKSLPPFLQRAGHQVAVAVNGQDALEQVESFRPHLILLDILMPWMDGCECLRRLRRAGDRTPVIMLTTVDSQDEKVLALSAGADDYVTKPFHRPELLARIGAVLRRAQAGQVPRSEVKELISNDLRLNLQAQTACLGARPLKLSHKAVQVLEYLMTHRDEVITRERFLDVLWDASAYSTTRAVDARIAELRRALGDARTAPRFIETVSAVGYRFVGPVQAVLR